MTPPPPPAEPVKIIEGSSSVNLPKEESVIEKSAPVVTTPKYQSDARQHDSQTGANQHGDFNHGIGGTQSITPMISGISSSRQMG